MKESKSGSHEYAFEKCHPESTTSRLIANNKGNMLLMANCMLQLCFGICEESGEGTSTDSHAYQIIATPT